MFLEENNLEGKQYHFLKSIQVEEAEELSRKRRTKLLYKELQVRDQGVVMSGNYGQVVKKPRES